uniref:Ras-related protein Rab-35 n=1 Tax=Sciurus vulgaris TaxID=55149 RepID=A0A8D2B5C8_SCIVU
RWHRRRLLKRRRRRRRGSEGRCFCQFRLFVREVDPPLPEQPGGSCGSRGQYRPRPPARTAPARHGPGLRPPLQAAHHRRQRCGQEQLAVTIRRQHVLRQLHHHHRSGFQDSDSGDQRGEGEAADLGHSGAGALPHHHLHVVVTCPAQVNTESVAVPLGRCPFCAGSHHQADSSEVALLGGLEEHGYYRGTHGVIVVYDVTSAESFVNVKRWLHEINQNCDDVCRILVGNKNDDPERKVVETEDAYKFAGQMGIQLFETSAKENVNVEEMFNCITELVLRAKKDNLAKQQQQQQNDVVKLTKNSKRKKRCC